MTKLFLLSCLLVITWGCSVNETETLPSTSIEILDSLLAGAPFSYIDLGQASVDTLIIEQENVIGYETVSSLTLPGLFGYITGLITVGDSLYVSDRSQNNIWVVNREGDITRSIGREGSGPGEFRLLQGITRNSKNVFALDATPTRATVYDSLFNFMTYIDLPPSSNQIIATDSLILNPFLGSGSSNLVRTFQANPPFNEGESFFPRLIPVGMGPPVYNTITVQASSNIDNRIQYVAAYNAFPYLFFYDKNLNHVFTLVLQGAVYDGLNNPIPEIKPITDSFFANVEVLEAGLKLPISNMILAEDGSLMLALRNPFTLYHIVPQGNGYEVESVWRLAFENPATDSGTMQSLDQIDNLFFDSNTLYLSMRQQPYVFKVNF